MRRAVATDAGLMACALLLMAAAAPPSLDAQRQARAVERDADQAGATAAAARVRALQARLVALGAQEQDGRRTAGGARARLRQLDLQEAELRLRMGRNQESLTHLLGALQMYRRNPPPALLVDPRSARDAVRATLLIEAVTPELTRRARTFAAQAEELKRMRRQAAVASGTLFQTESALADRQARIQDLIDQKRALETQLHADAAAADADVRRLAARARSMGELVQALDVRGQGPGADADLPARLTAPVAGAPAHGFGQAGADARRDRGLTWSVDPDAAVLSPAAATVDYAGPLKGWGLVLILKAGDYRLVLAGLGSISAETGRTVAAGEPVGQMPGETEAGGVRPELYLELRRAGRPVDPVRWFAAASEESRRG